MGAIERAPRMLQSAVVRDDDAGEAEAEAPPAFLTT
jgi:hypothetical protein